MKHQQHPITDSIQGIRTQHTRSHSMIYCHSKFAANKNKNHTLRSAHENKKFEMDCRPLHTIVTLCNIDIPEKCKPHIWIRRDTLTINMFDTWPNIRIHLVLSAKIDKFHFNFYSFHWTKRCVRHVGYFVLYLRLSTEVDDEKWEFTRIGWQVNWTDAKCKWMQFDEQVNQDCCEYSIDSE